MGRILGDVHTELAEPPFTTAGLPTEVVSQRYICTIYVSSGEDGNPRKGKWGLFVWMDRGGPDERPWKAEQDAYRGQNGEGLTPDERRYVAAGLHAKAELLLATADEP